MENNPNNETQISNEKENLDKKTLPFIELIKLLKNKDEEKLSFEIWKQIENNKDSKENKKLQKHLKIIIEDNDDSSYNKYFNYEKNTSFYNAYILFNLYQLIDSKREKTKFINDQFLKNKIWKNYLHSFSKNKFYCNQKTSDLIQLLGRNYFIFYLIEIYKILISNNEIKNNEKLYNDIIEKILKCWNYLIEETVEIAKYLRNLKNLNKSLIKHSIIENNNNLKIYDLIDSYNQIIKEIAGIIISNDNIIKIILEMENFEDIIYDGIIRNTFTSIAEIIGQFLMNLFKKFESIITINNSEKNYLYKFFFVILNLIFEDISKKVLKIINELPNDLNEDILNEKNILDYEKNIKIFFTMAENLLNYIYIFNYENKVKKLDTFIDYFNKEIIFLYKTNIDKIETQNYYEILYGGICSIIFKLIIEINSNKKKKNQIFENIELNLVYKDYDLKNFLFEKILFYQCLKKDEKSSENPDIDTNHLKIKSKYTFNHINDLFILLIEIDFNKINLGKHPKENNNIDQNITKYLSTLNNIHKSNFWLGNTISSWKLNHKDKIKNNKYTGLQNFGNTCYMNSLIQILYNIGQFRDSILKCKCTDTEKNILYELKNLFFSLQYLVDIQFFRPISFQQNFEGGPINPREQMDVDEFFNILIDKLENRLKGTNNENLVKYIFQGKQNDNIIFEEGCPHKRTNVNNFYSIQLQVKNKKNIYESLDTFIEGEHMTGDNSILCEKCNRKIPSIKNQDFKTLPRILMFVLKRFEFDYNKMTRYKINDYFEFPLELDMNKYTSDYINGNKKNDNNKYFLRGLVIHSGSCEMGHYYSIIKNIDTKNEDWFLYNDTIVRKFDIDDLKEEAFGNEIINDDNYNNINSKINNSNINNNQAINNENYNKYSAKIENNVLNINNGIKNNRNIDNNQNNNDGSNNKYNNNTNNNNNNNYINADINNSNKSNNMINNNKQNNTNTQNDNNNYSNNYNSNKINANNKKDCKNIDDNTINNKDNELDFSFNNDNDINIYNKKENNIIVYDTNNNITNIPKDINNTNNNCPNNNITPNYSNNTLFKKSGKSAYLLFYEKVSKENCEKFDKIEAINPISIYPKNANKEAITSSNIAFLEKFNFLKNMNSSDNSKIIKSINEEMYKYYLLKKLLSNEYHHFLLVLYVNLLNYYFSNNALLLNNIKNKCGTPFYFCFNSKDSIYSDKDYFYKREEKQYSNLYNYLETNKLIFFQIKDSKNTDQNFNKDKIVKIFEHLLLFFFNVKIRTTNKKCFGEYVDLIKFFINNFIYCNEYFLDEFCVYNVMVEYLVNCPINEIKKIIVGIINCAMINMMENFKKKQNIKEKEKMTESQEKNEIIKLLGGCGKKKNNLNFYRIINFEKKEIEKIKENDKNEDKSTDITPEGSKDSMNENPYKKNLKELTDIKTISTSDLNENKIEKKDETIKIEKEYLPKIMIQFINNIIALINEIGFSNIVDIQFLIYILYKFSIISFKTKEYLIKVIPVLQFMNINLNKDLDLENNSSDNVDIKKYFDYSHKHDILNINSNNEKVKVINDKGGLYHYENYLYLLYFSLLTYENYNEKIYSIDNKNFLFKLFAELINKQDCFVFANLLNIKCLDNKDIENLVIDLISKILDIIDYKENATYKLNKVSNNTKITNIKNYKNKYELDPRNILLTLKLFILFKDNKGNTIQNRIETAFKKLIELIKKYDKYFSFCMLLIDFIIDLFLYNKKLIKDYVKQFKKEFEYIEEWLKKNPISPILYKIEGLYMYRDDNVDYQKISEQQKIEFDTKEKDNTNQKLKNLKSILKRNVNEKEYLFDSNAINMSEFTFLNDDQIIFNGKHAVVKEHLNEMIKIKFDVDLVNKIDINKNKDNELYNISDKNNENENKVISKMWIEIDNENLKINKLYNQLKN